MGVLLPAVDHVLAYALQLLVDAVGLYHWVVVPQGVPEGVGEGADGAVLEESVAEAGRAGAPGGVPVAATVHQVVEQGRRVEQGLWKKIVISTFPVSIPKTLLL